MKKALRPTMNLKYGLIKVKTVNQGDLTTYR